ncbi:LuxR C-terminal-related transcriptional regulator [Chitinophaga filiformis]|uniref:LuxR C-terminal-related transcriptional regulator n=1 Tax=Chitinophaga filiformis TaxID=104663 RepID=A0ABY4I3P4_CHIFI|nr:LuxR C-terminal-related transcriptional regulator [Chitinophaga filiformis]UPK70717.1 LuxR C-terminal-related transcriptional regulator [Chitinophaga filiformis]
MLTDSDMGHDYSLNALQKENELLKTRIQSLEGLLNNVPAMLYTHQNSTKTINWCNRYMEDVTGYTMAEMNSMGLDFFKDIMHPDDFELAVIAQQSFKENKNVFGGVLRFRRRGTDNWCWLAGIAIPYTRDEQGNVQEVICAFVDMTMAMDTNDQLTEAMLDVMRRKHEDLISKLTPREKEILKLSVKGLNNKEIAATLNLSRYTIETHRKNIRIKLKVRNTTELIALARKVGYQ